MGKTALIIKREFLSRIRKKSFIIMALIGPLLIGGFMAFGVWLNEKSASNVDILVVDRAGYIEGNLRDFKGVKFESFRGEVEQGISLIEEGEFDCLLILERTLTNPLKGERVQMYYRRLPSIPSMQKIEIQIEDAIEDFKIKDLNITRGEFKNAKVKVNLQTIHYNDSNSSGMTAISIGFGLVLALSIYLFIFMYGVQVMRGVIEEKTSRIVEIIISSVKPMQLMKGKIIGIGMAGITQFFIWIILSTTIVLVLKAQVEKDTITTAIEQGQVVENVKTSANIDLGTTETSKMDVFDYVLNHLSAGQMVSMLGWFLIYFIGGYLLYASLFAGIGSAVDAESDTQQFMLPITIPLLLSIFTIQSVLADPEGPLAFWLSIIPFTSPITMMVRVPFGPPLWEVLLSLTLLFATAFFCIWFAGKIYRTGILMFGKKASYKEIIKWIRYH